MKKIIVMIILAGVFTSSCSQGKVHINGFDAAANEKISQFLEKTASYEGRKVAVFDGDGTVFGQVPHYLADECLFQDAQKNPAKKPEIIRQMQKQSNVSLPYVVNRIYYLEGNTLEEIRDMGVRCFQKDYPDKIYPPMKELISILKKHNFEVWIITASPEALYQKFLSRELGIPITNVVGVKSVVSGGKITNRIVEPVPQDHGKKEAIETFVQVQPLLAGGNSRGDKEMIEFASELSLIVNPDEFVAPDQEISMAEYARKNGWLVVKIPDVPAKNFPSVTSSVNGIKPNKTRGIP